MDDEPRVPPLYPANIFISPHYYFGQVREQLVNGNIPAAIETFISGVEFLENSDDLSLRDQITLTKLVLALAETADGTEETEDTIMVSFLAIINNFPQNAIALNAFAAFMFNGGEYHIARGYLEKATACGYLPAEKNLLHVLWHLIPRWHYRMLNDRARNECYKKAITQALRAGYKHVFDIGSGCGLLTLIAASTKVKGVRVTAFEENKTLYSIAENVFKGNKLKNVQAVWKNTNEVEQVDGHCNLIVTEIFDAALFGENCLATIKHALNHFVAKRFMIIPAGAQVYLTAIEAHRLNKKIRYVGNLPEINLQDICLREVDQGLYDAEYLRKEEVKYLSETTPFLMVDFYNKAQLEAMTEEECDKIPEVELIMNDDGFVHAFAVWFDLHLTSEVKFSTSPFDSRIKCWEQGIFYLEHPVRVCNGERLLVKPKLINGQITFIILNRRDDCQKCFRVSREVISFLNDAELVSSIVRGVETYANYDIKIVDMNTFPLYGLLMAKKGATVYHIYKDQCDLEFINSMMEANGISIYKFVCIFIKAMDHCMVYLTPPDVVFSNIIRTDGSWNHLDMPFEHNEPRLIYDIVPQRIILKAQLIFSSYLDICNKVDDSKALNFKIAQHINEFTGTEHPDLESFDYDYRSPIVSADISDLNMIDFHMDSEMIKDGLVNGILYWYGLQFSQDESVLFDTKESWHYNKTCTLLRSHKLVKQGDRLTIHVLRVDGYMKIYLD